MGEERRFSRKQTVGLPKRQTTEEADASGGGQQPTSSNRGRRSSNTRLPTSDGRLSPSSSFQQQHKESRMQYLGEGRIFPVRERERALSETSPIGAGGGIRL